jgi:hypothetical protein
LRINSTPIRGVLNLALPQWLQGKRKRLKMFKQRHNLPAAGKARYR